MLKVKPLWYQEKKHNKQTQKKIYSIDVQKFKKMNMEKMQN